MRSRTILFGDHITVSLARAITLAETPNLVAQMGQQLDIAHRVNGSSPPPYKTSRRLVPGQKQEASTTGPGSTIATTDEGLGLATVRRSTALISSRWREPQSV